MKKFKLSWPGWLIQRRFLIAYEARVTGPNLVVHGYVLNNAVREQALKIASATSKLAVIDELKINPNLVLSSGMVSAEDLRHAAVYLLTNALADQMARFEVKATTAGQVTVSGSILSYEEKLAVSERLRRLLGCTSRCQPS